jgi:DNA mismatch repair ATPase MutS
MSEIFEPSIETLQAEIEKLKGNKGDATETASKAKVKKSRKPLDEATKERLRAQLAKGRATSLAKRRAKREMNKLNKAKEVVANEEEIVLGTKTNKELQEELKALKEQVKLKEQSKKKKPKKEKLKVIIEESEEEESDESSEEESEEEEVIVVKKKKPKKPKAEPKKEIVKETHIELPKKIEAPKPDPMAMWLKKRKQSKYS